MNKRTKIIMVAIAVIVVAVIVIAAAVKMGSSAEKTTGGTTNKNVSSTNETLTSTDKETKKGEEGTNYWDNVEVYEETQNKETEVVTNKKGEEVTEAYPGEHQGWSPIVSPDDLKSE